MGAFFAVQHGLLFLIQVHLHTISFFRRKTAGCAALSIAILPREGKEGGSIPARLTHAGEIDIMLLAGAGCDACCKKRKSPGFFFPCTVQGKKVPYLQQIGA